MTLGPLTHHPGQGQGTAFIDHVQHQRTTSPAHPTAIHGPYQRLQGQAIQEHLGIRQKINLFLDLLIVEPSRQAFDPTFGLGLIRDLGGNARQLATFTAHNAADERGQCRQMLGHTTAHLTWVTLCQGPTYGTIAPKVVTHRIHLLVKFIVKWVYTMRQPFLNAYTKRAYKCVR